MKRYSLKLVLLTLLMLMFGTSLASGLEDSKQKKKPQVGSSAKGTDKRHPAPSIPKVENALPPQIRKPPLPPSRNAEASVQSGNSNNPPIQPTAQSDGESLSRSGNQNRNAPNMVTANLSTESWFADPLFIVAAAVFTVLFIGLHAFHLITQLRLKQDFAQAQGDLRRIHYETQGALEKLRYEIQNILMTRQQSITDEPIHDNQSNSAQDNLNQSDHRLTEINAKVSDVEQKGEDTAKALRIATQWIGELKIEDSRARARNGLSDNDRERAIRLLERYRFRFRENAERVKGLDQAMSVLANNLEQKSYMRPELSDRIKKLHQHISQFDRWYAVITTDFNSLQRQSFSERSINLIDKEAKLAQSLKSDEILLSDYISNYKKIIKEEFSDGSDSLAENINPDEMESNLMKTLDQAPDYLMDWFDKFSQLHVQAASSTSQVDDQTIAEMTEVKRLACEALRNFDIQPDNIPIGEAAYNPDLMDAIVTRSPNYPANTVIAVERYGFRNISSGGVLRRPKVIVAGSGAI